MFGREPEYSGWRSTVQSAEPSRCRDSHLLYATEPAAIAGHGSYGDPRAQTTAILHARRYIGFAEFLSSGRRIANLCASKNSDCEVTFAASTCLIECISHAASSVGVRPLRAGPRPFLARAALSNSHECGTEAEGYGLVLRVRATDRPPRRSMVFP